MDFPRPSFTQVFLGVIILVIAIVFFIVIRLSFSDVYKKTRKNGASVGEALMAALSGIEPEVASPQVATFYRREGGIPWISDGQAFDEAKEAGFGIASTEAAQVLMDGAAEVDSEVPRALWSASASNGSGVVVVSEAFGGPNIVERKEPQAVAVIVEGTGVPNVDTTPALLIFGLGEVFVILAFFGILTAIGFASILKSKIGVRMNEAGRAVKRKLGLQEAAVEHAQDEIDRFRVEKRGDRVVVLEATLERLTQSIDTTANIWVRESNSKFIEVIRTTNARIVDREGNLITNEEMDRAIEGREAGAARPENRPKDTSTFTDRVIRPVQDRIAEVKESIAREK